MVHEQRHVRGSTLPATRNVDAANTAWLLAGSVALGLVALTFAEQALVDADRLAVVYRPLRIAMAGAAVTALAVS